MALAKPADMRNPLALGARLEIVYVATRFLSVHKGCQRTAHDGREEAQEWCRKAKQPQSAVPPSAAFGPERVLWFPKPGGVLESSFVPSVDRWNATSGPAYNHVGDPLKSSLAQPYVSRDGTNERYRLEEVRAWAHVLLRWRPRRWA